MRDRAAIRAAHDGGAGIRPLAREFGVDRNTVRRALDPDARTKYWRRSATEEATEAVRDVLSDYPLMAVTDIAVLIDWRHSRRALSNLVARLRPDYLGPSPFATLTPSALADVPALTLSTITVGALETGTLTLGRMT